MPATPPVPPAGASNADLAAAIGALQPMLRRLARLQLRNDAWADDAVSETMLAAVEGLARFDRRSQLRTWVVGILKHKIIDQFRRARRELAQQGHEALDDDQALDELFGSDGHRLADPLPWGDPEQALAQQEFFAILQACLDQMPAPLARAFLLREWLGLDMAGVCKELQVTATNASVMLYRARMRLRECLEARWFAAQGNRHGG